jgi:hypothetical protein
VNAIDIDREGKQASSRIKVHRTFLKHPSCFWKGKEQFPGSPLPLLSSTFWYLVLYLQTAELVGVGGRLTGTVQIKSLYKMVVIRRELKTLLRRCETTTSKLALSVAVMHNLQGG